MLIRNPKQRGILIVDDDSDLTEGLSESLIRDGYEKVLTANRSAEAVSTLAHQDKDIYLVLLDLKLPSMDGFEVMKHLANVHQYPVGIIMITGYHTVEAEACFYKTGTDTIIAAGYFAKPFSFEKLAADVEMTLEKIHSKRKQQFNISSEVLFQRVDNLERQLTGISEVLPEIKKELSEISRKQQGFLAELGMELLKVVVIALAIIGIIYFEVDDFIRSIIQSLR